MTKRAASSESGAPADAVEIWEDGAPHLEPDDLAAILTDCRVPVAPKSMADLKNVEEAYRFRRACEIATPPQTEYERHLEGVLAAFQRVMETCFPSDGDESLRATAISTWARLETRALTDLKLTPDDNRQLLAHGLYALRLAALELSVEALSTRGNAASNRSAFDSLVVNCDNFFDQTSRQGTTKPGTVSLIWSFYTRSRHKAGGTYRQTYFQEVFANRDSVKRAVSRARTRINPPVNPGQ